MKLTLALAMLIALPTAAFALPSGEFTNARIDNASCSRGAASTATCVNGTASASASDPGQSSASAQASLADGTVSIANSAGSVAGDYSASLAEIWDSFAFQGVLSGQTATLTITGNASVNGSATLNYFAELVSAGNVFPPDGGNGALTPISSAGAFTFTTTFAITNGTLDNGAYILNAGLQGTSGLCGGNGCPGDVTANATFTLTLPDNVTFTANAATAAAPIGEPGWLFPSFLAMGAVLTRRKIRRTR